MPPLHPKWPFAIPRMARADAVSVLNDAQAGLPEKKAAVASFAVSYEGILPHGALQLLERKGSLWCRRDESEILERPRDTSLIEASRREPTALGNRLQLLTDMWISQERTLRGSPTLSARLVMRSASNDFLLGPVRNPLIARHLICEALQECSLENPALDLIIGVDPPHNMIEGLLVFLALHPFGSILEPPWLVEFPWERERHLEAQRLPPEEETGLPYRRPSPPPTFNEAGLKAFRWVRLPNPFPKRWISAPPHKILKTDEERRAFEILIVTKEEEYEIVWYPSHQDWRAIVGRPRRNKSVKVNEYTFNRWFDDAYRSHEATRPLEAVLEAAWRMFRVVAGRHPPVNNVGDLPGELREGLYDLLQRHSLGGGFLNEWKGNPELRKDIRELVADWLPRINAVPLP